MVADCETGSYSSICLFKLNVKTVIYVLVYETGSYSGVCFGSVSKQRYTYMAMKLFLKVVLILVFVLAQRQNSDLRTWL